MKQSILKLDKHDIFELTYALKAYCNLWHDGMWSDTYAIGCDIDNYLTCGMGFSESDIEENNEYYHEINEDNLEGVWNRVKYYLDNRWDD